MKPVSPHTTLLSLLAVAILCAMLMLLVPKGGLKLGAVDFKFKSWASVFDTTKTKLVDVNQYLAALDSMAVDSLVTDSLDSLIVIRKQGLTSLQFKDNVSSSLFSFFEALVKARDEKTTVHVLHYGDSQIEGDRMTGVLREKWQSSFGGNGPGLVSPSPIAPGAHIKQSQSGNWKRYTAYGFDDAKAKHSRFGAMASYARFSPSKAKEEINVADTLEGWFEVSPSGMAGAHARNYSKATLFFGNHLYPIQLFVEVNDSIISTETIEATSAIIQRTWTFGSTPKRLRIRMKGVDSPDVHSLVLQSASGVYVDNISLRGSSGTMFKRINHTELTDQYAVLSPDLIILQFGGNSVPFIENEAGSKSFGSYFQSQIQYLKKLAPHAAFIVIGPSDMSTSVDGVYQTWPYLENVRDAMKEAAFASGCAFWDMYEVMGGKNSMVSWVNNNPPYAATDYTHFSPAGSRKMGEFLYSAIHAEYEAWLNAQSK